MVALQTSDVPAVFAAQILFWILLPFVLFAAPRWAVLAWLIMGNLDATGPGSSVSSAVGWMNAAKGSLLPLYVWWRLGELRVASSHLFRRDSGCYLSLMRLGTVWSPFPLAAAKSSATWPELLLTFIVLEKAARSGCWTFAQSLILIRGVPCSWRLYRRLYFGGVAYGFDGFGRSCRFSGFLSLSSMRHFSSLSLQ